MVARGMPMEAWQLLFLVLMVMVIVLIARTVIERLR
jgi:hypothetical protein